MATVKLTPASGKVVGTHSDMPLLIIPSEITNLGTLTLAEAQSCRIYSDITLTTELAREVVSADEIHVKVGSVTTSTEIWFDYDGVRSDYAVTDTYGRNAVWSDYERVYHLNATGTQTDSSGNGNDLTENGNPTATTGKVGGAIDLDGTGDYYGGSATDVATGTAQGWFNRTGTGSQQLFSQDKSGQDSGDVAVYHISGSDDFEVRISTGGSTSVNSITDNSFPVSTWCSFAFIFGTGGLEMFVNGTSKLTNAGLTVGFSPTTGRVFRLGSNFSGTENFNGDIDEFRLCNVRRDSNWLTTEYNNQNDNATFWVAESAGVPEFLPGYTSRWEYTIDATKVPSTQTNFPVYVDLSDMPASFWSVVANGGGDIRVTRSDGETEVAREVVSCDTATDTGELHFLANTVDGTTNTKYYIYANGTSADYAVTDTYGRNAVWGDYRAVWHLGGVVDSTGNGLTLTKSGTVADVVGKVGNGSDLTGGTSGSFLTIPDGAHGNPNEFSYSIWAKFDTLSPGTALITWQHDYNTQLFQRTSPNEVVHEIFDGSVARSPSSGAISTGVWFQFVADYDGTTNRIYKDGSLSNSLSSNSPSSVNVASRIGAHRTGLGTEIDGIVDEVRLRYTSRSANWITTEYNNQSDHSTWATIGAEENPGGGVVNNALYSFGGM